MFEDGVPSIISWVLYADFLGEADTQKYCPKIWTAFILIDSKSHSKSIRRTLQSNWSSQYLRLCDECRNCCTKLTIWPKYT